MKKTYLFLIILIVAAAGAVGFLIFKNVRQISKQTAPKISENIPQKDGQSQVSGAVKKSDSDNAAATAANPKKVADDLQSQMPDLNRPVVITANLSENEKSKIKKEIEDTISQIKSNYNYLQVWLQLGILRKFIGDYEGARQAWEFAAILRPQSFIPFNNLGDLYGFYLKDYSKSEKNYLKSIENDPKNIDAYKSLADIYQYAYTEKKGEVGGLLLKGIAANPEDSSLMIALARYYVDAGNSAAALTYYSNALKIDPNNNEIKNELAEVKASFNAAAAGKSR